MLAEDNNRTSFRAHFPHVKGGIYSAVKFGLLSHITLLIWSVITHRLAYDVSLGEWTNDCGKGSAGNIPNCT